METNKINLRFWVLVAIIFLAAFSRLIPHPSNFAPLGAIALFGAAYFNKKWQAFIIPITATWLSDMVINNTIYSQYYPEFTWVDESFYFPYGAYLLITLAGIFILRKVTLPRIILASLASSTIFFLVSNFGCFPGNSGYTQDINGLMSCYAAGMADNYALKTMLGDLVYSGLLFGSFEWLQSRFPALQFQPTNSTESFK